MAQLQGNKLVMQYVSNNDLITDKPIFNTLKDFKGNFRLVFVDNAMNCSFLTPF